MNFVRRPMARAAYALLVTGVLMAGAACGSEISGTPERTPSDTSQLDVGNYPTAPRGIGNAKNDKQARARESQRLADFVMLPYEADPSYVEDTWAVRSHVVLNRKSLDRLVINDTFDDVAKDLVAGWVNAWSTGGAVDAPRRVLNIAVLMFPDAQTAAQVGPTLEHDDFTYNRDNEPVSIPEHLNTTAHWRPGVSSIGSWTVKDRYVVFIKVIDDTAAPDLLSLTGHVDRALDVQLPLLDKFQPTPAAELPRIPLDPGGLLGRTLPSNPESPMRAEPDGLYTGRGSVTLLVASPDTLPELERSGIDLVSFGDAVVFRSRNASGSESLWRAWRPSSDLDEKERKVGGPTGILNDIECVAHLVKAGDPSSAVAFHRCVFRVDRYTVQVAGRSLQDVHQKVSAQYALLTSN
ncbi:MULTISPECIES: DUF7373 family lipoprotein [Nocardia]|uniref:DUF7373 family lipoprotein n=1 Tax=Nocardia TaxID=1817 RepID=UPI001E59AA3F|nr:MULTISPECIES: hypothetical protein [Nocardia]